MSRRVGYHERIMQTPRWRGELLVAYGLDWTPFPPQVGDLTVAGATRTRPGHPRRIAAVYDRVSEDGREYWLIEHVGLDDDLATADRVSVGFWCAGGWPRLPEHYPVCGTCRELMPCMHSVVDAIASDGVEKLERFADPSVCPACREVITLRQKTVMFDRNLHGFGIVVFHARKKCIGGAWVYDRELHDGDGQYQLHCPGRFYGGVGADGKKVGYCSEEHCRGIDMRHMQGGFWTAGQLDCPDGYFPIADRPPDAGGGA
ncbi:hypothetical protein [Gordonia malaquae]|uniref:hypothetical protein n=1 Tax=Gordonia malaquae TaxID=410332 RepID=UPI003016AF04